MPYFCGMGNEIVILDSIEKFNRQCGFETLHPLASVVDMAKAKGDFGTARLNYGEAEALHLAERERRDYMEILGSIQAELSHSIDKYSRELLCDRIGLLLDLCLRFYDRQFITREVANKDLLADFDRHLNAYFKEGMAARKGLPTVAYFSDKLCLSTGYFGDLIKKETGMTAQRYIQNKIIDLSKRDLLGSTLSVSEIAYSLGFDYPQHFTRLFKKQTGLSPTEYRNQIN